MGGPARALRVAGYVFGLVAAFAVLLVLLSLVAPPLGLRVPVGTWRVPAALPVAVVAGLLHHGLSGAANRREREAR